ncbi:solute carrier family 25 member 45-like [Amphibalanus amphitrite]|uniref:solute carrier family 25 member 45-like n=1 Tax=Amphibalanus amphitrite TaxID=1232801 RepID=UPI001C902E33|nr:solute carrier family 25 member 45-like [Amphibalanus amphitrite]
MWTAEAWHDFAAGWAGGSLGILCGHPLDTIKVRQQALLVSPLRCLTATLRHEGARGLFKGLAFPLVSAGAVNSVFFGVYYNCLRHLNSGGGGGGAEAPLRHVAAAGALGGLAQLAVAVPVDLVKIQLQTRTGASGGWVRHYQTPAAGPLACLAALYRAGGAAAWYRGFGVQLLRDVPASAAYFVLYEAGVRWARSHQVPSAAAVLVAGGAAGVLSWSLILPLDVVKSRIQADSPERPQFRGVVHCARETVIRDGPAALFRGFTTMATRGFVVNAATFFGYEYFMVGIKLVA